MCSFFKKRKIEKDELQRALTGLDESIYSHQYYIDNPEKQSKHTGDTERNQRIIKKYEFIKELLKRG